MQQINVLVLNFVIVQFHLYTYQIAGSSTLYTLQ